MSPAAKPLWTAAAAARASRGFALGDWAASGVSIDSRTLAPGDLFVALTAGRDGHDFVAAALEKGAAAAMVTHIPENVPRDAPLLLVKDVLAGLVGLARTARRRSRARVAAITGSVGKTSAKEMLRAALEGQGRVHAAEASYNNHWGVPLTLARMPRETDFAVIEIGMNRPGEIAPLARLAKPHVAMITTVAAAHLEAFESLEGIAAEKASICDGLEPGGLAVLNGDIDTAPILRAAATRAGATSVSFGENADNSLRLLSVDLHDEATVARAVIGDEVQIFRLATPGRHFAATALGVLGVAGALGADVTLAARALGLWQPPPGRGTRETILLDPVEGLALGLIDDAFNANPTSMAAALEVLAASHPTDRQGRVSKGRRIAVLGDMLELGATETALHEGLADLPALAAADVVHCVGPRMRALWERLPAGRQGTWCETAEDLAARVRKLIDAGDVLLVKGSKGSRVSLVVDAVRKLGHPAVD
ncbi:UDP-N-acetylmuramoyl-tripeptide--D-alanyl-D-alanine ligase [Maritimibacter sp. HL-12]|uniref:UDP-N-acetylmuramoyl-tripeptide--D-alanyl-D- alanine ligase n=1 Tax=Maritimibacter sp. HL-12 TaxID=1162418 RepID=UPI000A0F398F|nr:UDP-N-acetylmuramoyl-tripeptide--D-alanyl-D-alanine ligase [Maritimibacter sp. HL-12]SMH53963.1 UDP-N-acetylmuramoyl-tripeptide--D-alanyl-D-alanine ligase [Maritimibacter sp. HL-12]